MLRSSRLACVALLVLGWLSGCSSEDSDAPAGPLPEKIRKAGVIRVATNYSWPPFAFEDENGKVVGFDIDLINAIAKDLGVKADFENLTFDVVIPSVVNGRFDMAANGFGDTPERRKVVQFVDYADSGIGVMVRKNYKERISPSDLCGHTLALTQGSTVADRAPELSKRCTDAGKPRIKPLLFSDNAPTILAVVNGRADAYLADPAVGTYLAQTRNETLEVLPGVVPDTERKTGLIIGKNNHALLKAVQRSLQRLMDNGTYGRIVAKWKLPGAVDKATINDG